MKLDKRIIEGKKPLDCFDTDVAKQFIGKKGLFSTYDSQFMNLDTCPKCYVDELKSVDDYDDYPFITSSNHSYRLFLPAEWVNLKKKYRPYSIREFEDMLASKKDDFVCFRFKLADDKVSNLFHKLRYLGYILTEDENFEEPGEGCLHFGNNISGSPKYLFEHLELLSDDGKWIPFGVEVEEE